jgi:hypothetical protein
LSRPECHLCEEFREQLLAEFPSVELEEACVDDRADWRERYGRDIPVLLTADGAELCRHRFDAVAVARFLGAKAAP